jgi:predicted short-subunit dehydrogenase-like oxidoreductase (DUF2520 family)
MSSVRIIGPGRAGLSLAGALERIGWSVRGVLGRDHDPTNAADGVDVVVLAVPDGAIGAVARSLRPEPSTAVLHLSGSLGLEVLGPHARRAALHPLVPLPEPGVGAARLCEGVTFAVAGDPVATEMALALGGRPVTVADADRAAYHAAACIASNHVVALLGQVERVAARAGLDLTSFVPLARAAVEDAAALGPGRALTGPAVRGDWVTLERHLVSLDPAERPGYKAGVGLALQLATGRGQDREPDAPGEAPAEPVDAAVAVVPAAVG